MASQQLTVVTRQRLLDLLVVEKVWWWGALDEVKFLERLYDLDTLEGDGYRRPTAREDIWQHCINNDDWPPEWVFTDARFGLSHDSPQPLLNFLAEMLHPVVRRDPVEVENLAKKLNGILTKDGFELYPTEYISGLPVYSGGPCASFHGVRPDMKFGSRPGAPQRADRRPPHLPPGREWWCGRRTEGVLCRRTCRAAACGERPESR
ncbi:hypothetical protein ACFWC5_16435 [Streptomyces sp. NPDC060085]|uniref:AbiJ-related protein n=1 Tax=Streptomyces sp. NPDC060085 TaxID=3347054 RepID=UPI00364918A1